MGRKLSFDVEEALDAAMRVFWEKGYEGASLDDLTAAMGVQRPSLYHCFGNKETLFRRAFRRYEQNRLGFILKAVRAADVQTVVRDLLNGVLDLVTGTGNPKGSLDINAVVACSADAEAVRLLLVGRRAFYQRLLRRRFVKALREGDLDATIRPDALAHFLLIIGSGLALQAKADVSRCALEGAIDLAFELAAARASADAGRGQGARPALQRNRTATP